VEHPPSSYLFGCSGPKEVLFEAGSHLRRIEGFQFYRSLIRIDIPASVRLIESSAFSGWSGLKEVIFEAESHLRRINGFKGCGSLILMNIPASVEFIGSLAFSGRALFLQLRMRMRMSFGMRIRAVGRSGGF
jgi:hypothetical protein